MSKKSIALPRRKILAILLGFVFFQIIFFPYNAHTFGNLQIPFPGSIGFFITLLSANLITLLAFKNKSFLLKSKYAKIAALLSIVPAFATLFRASFFSQFLLTGLSLFWWGTCFYLSILKSDRFGSLSEIFAIPIRTGLALPAAASRFLKLFSKISFEGGRVNKYATKIFLGLVITIPAAGLLLILLSSADPVFGHFLNQIFNFNFTITEFVAQSIWRVFFSVIFIVFLTTLILTKIKKPFVSPLNQLRQQSSQLLGPYLLLCFTFCLILLAFLTIQFRYLFAISDLSDLVAVGIPTFSEYVRKGFFELIIATGLIYSVCAAGFVIYRNNKPNKIHLILSSTLILLNFLLGLAAYRRVSLYTIEHGLTHIRIYGVMLLIIIAIFLASLFIRFIIKKHKLYLFEILASSLVVFGFGIGNIDYLLAHVAPPTVNQEVDFNYLSRLSADDVESWVSVYGQIKQDTPDLKDAITVQRYFWAMDRIYSSVGKLAIKYDYFKASEVFTDDYRFNSKHNWTDFNIKEYSSFLVIKHKISYEELKQLRADLLQKQTQIVTHLPEDIYQFY